MWQTSTLSFKVLDPDFPADGRNRTPTLVTGENEALPGDAGFTRADGHRPAAGILDSGVGHRFPDQAVASWRRRARTQNSLPSGSASTTHDCSPWPMSTR